MFWYIKYPLIIILILALLGLSGIVWRSCLKTVPRPEPPETETSVVHPATSLPDSASTAALPLTQSSSHAPINREYSRIENLLDSAEKQLQHGKLEAARMLALNALKVPGLVEYDRYWFRAADVINEANRRFMNNGAPCAEKTRYTVQAGDNLSKIASKFYTSVSALKRLNGLQGDNPVIQQRQVITYLRGVWSIKVSKQQFVMTLYNDGVLYRYYRIGIGREDRTPTGDFAINSRIAHPAWTPPGKNIPYGSPENVLGTHWLGLIPMGATDPTLSGYGIHGTWEPDSIGTAVSSGCVRLRNEEIEELFDFIPEPGGMAPPVRVRIVE
jgi:lipoprotein-anchoring transpeptidase ErfK/SrfK